MNKAERGKWKNANMVCTTKYNAFRQNEWTMQLNWVYTVTTGSKKLNSVACKWYLKICLCMHSQTLIFLRDHLTGSTLFHQSCPPTRENVLKSDKACQIFYKLVNEENWRLLPGFNIRNKQINNLISGLYWDKSLE